MDKFTYSQKRKNRIIMFFTSLILILMIAFSSRQTSEISVGENTIGIILSPVNKFFYSVVSKISELGKTIFNTKEFRDNYYKLESENIQMKNKIMEMENIISKESYLKSEYELLQNTQKKLKAANVIAKDSGNVFTRFVIDKGSADNVKIGDIILQGYFDENSKVIEAVLGKVTEVGLNWSKVSSIIDESESVSFKVSNSNEIGVISGDSKYGLSGYLFNYNADVKVNEKILTSGVGGIYPPNLYIGEIKEVSVDDNELVKKIVVESPINYNNVFRVVIMENEYEIKQ